MVRQFTPSVYYSKKADPNQMEQLFWLDMYNFEFSNNRLTGLPKLKASQIKAKENMIQA